MNTQTNTIHILKTFVGHEKGTVQAIQSSAWCKAGTVLFFVPHNRLHWHSSHTRVDTVRPRYLSGGASSDLRAGCLWMPNRGTIQTSKTFVGHENGTVRTLLNSA